MDKTKKTKEPIKDKIAIPEGMQIELEGNIITVKNDKTSLTRNLNHPLIKLEKKNNEIILVSKDCTKKNKRIINTTKAHINNLIKGVKEGFIYKLKICSGHFPMTVKQEGEKIIITNFLGEKIPRTSKIVNGTTVKIEKDTITVEGANIEDAGQTAANLEKATKIKNRDRRIFQDGIYIIKKPRRMK